MAWRLPGAQTSHHGQARHAMWLDLNSFLNGPTSSLEQVGGQKDGAQASNATDPGCPSSEAGHTSGPKPLPNSVSTRVHRAEAVRQNLLHTRSEWDFALKPMSDVGSLYLLNLIAQPTPPGDWEEQVMDFVFPVVCVTHDGLCSPHQLPPPFLIRSMRDHQLTVVWKPDWPWSSVEQHWERVVHQAMLATRHAAQVADTPLRHTFRGSLHLPRLISRGPLVKHDTMSSWVAIAVRQFECRSDGDALLWQQLAADVASGYDDDKTKRLDCRRTDLRCSPRNLTTSASHCSLCGRTATCAREQITAARRLSLARELVVHKWNVRPTPNAMPAGRAGRLDGVTEA
ncbi:hypothetical protein HaLaN_15626 [Haematococcus lacustris]|uniref:Uncharacterized protein n=1 Tax=Haematococcus lacustris TaxID=44745 RepID=A0A699ZBJ0_HAELA|nr:hypothetical protein HaLaN_15626 [Haematococcus lacustris]